MEQLAEIDEEEPPELEEDDEQETEIEAVERMKSSIIEQFEEQIESISLLQVIAGGWYLMLLAFTVSLCIPVSWYHRMITIIALYLVYSYTKVILEI